MISLCKVTTVFAFVLLSSRFSSSMKLNQQECKDDADCQNGAIHAQYYCDNSYCEPCIPCGERFKREPPTGTGCARVEDDCGSCLRGYLAEDWVNQRRSWYCILSLASLAEAPPESNETWKIALLAVIGLLVSIGVIVVLVQFCKRPTATRPTAKLEEYQLVPTNSSPSAPPPPYYTIESHVDEPDNAMITTVRQTQPTEPSIPLERDNLIRATPFQPVRICPLHHEDQDQQMLDEDAILLMVHRQPSLDSYSNASTGNISSTDHIEEHQDSTASLNREVAIDSIPSASVPRSFSLELLNQHRPSLSSYNSQSDPCLAFQERRRRNSTGGESYSYRRVQLSNHRIHSQSIESLATNLQSSQAESSSTLADDSQIPQPFEYISVDQPNRNLQLEESHIEGLPYHARVQLIRMHSSSPPDEENHGSSDSGFQEVAEVGFSLYIKRRRKD